MVSGNRAGCGAAFLRLLFGIAGCAYSIVIRVRNLLYDKGLLKSYAVTQAGLKTSDRSQSSVPVISAGNITVGGTGKTPMVIWLCDFLQTKGTNCAILTRGYKSKGDNDEPAVLAKNCPGAAVMVNPDRLAGAIEAVKRNHAQILIMDDGFQHRRLHRDVDIVTIDATCPFGFNRLLPAGLLREPVTSLKRAHAAIITRSNLVSKDGLEKLTDTLKRINPNMIIAQAVHSPICAMTAGGQQLPLEQLRGKPVFAFCGVANPEAFFATIGSLGATIVGSKIYDDHYNYTNRDVVEIMQIASQSGAEMTLTTEKDFNKISPLMANKTDFVVAYLAVKLQLVSGREQVIRLIEQTIAGKIQAKRAV